MSFWDDIGLISGAEMKKLLSEMEARMGAREDAAYDKINATIGTVKEGWAALQAENANLKSQLENAGVEFQAKLDADSEADAAKVEAADASLSELVAVAEQPPTEEPPVEENPAPPADGEPAPADNA
jgi:hypothetical protein